jgi:hypothetical protein
MVIEAQEKGTTFEEIEAKVYNKKRNLYNIWGNRTLDGLLPRL